MYKRHQDLLAQISPPSGKRLAYIPTYYVHLAAFIFYSHLFQDIGKSPDESIILIEIKRCLYFQDDSIFIETKPWL